MFDSGQVSPRLISCFKSLYVRDHDSQGSGVFMIYETLPELPPVSSCGCARTHTPHTTHTQAHKHTYTVINHKEWLALNRVTFPCILQFL